MLAGPHREKLERAESADNPQKQNEAQFLAGYADLLNQISNEIAALATIQRQAYECIIKRLPTFIYMDDYRTLEGNARLDQVLQRIDQPLPQDETLLMIFKLAGLDLKKLVEQGNSSDPATIRERQYDLQDAGEMLTSAVADRWAQNPYKVQFRADGQRFFTEIEELDKNIGMLPLEEQSRGFKWFFSFDLRFMHDSDRTFAECVLLLDEPGMHLHPGSQDDLLRRFDAYARENTLIYTTHLPFLVDLREPRRIHVMKEREDMSASVSDDLAASGLDEKLTLQAALGMKAINWRHQVQPHTTRSLLVGLPMADGRCWSGGHALGGGWCFPWSCHQKKRAARRASAVTARSGCGMVARYGAVRNPLFPLWPPRPRDRCAARTRPDLRWMQPQRTSDWMAGATGAEAAATRAGPAAARQAASFTPQGRIRGNAATDSDGKRPPIPIESGHLIRTKVLSTCPQRYCG
jgi:hypothetical protein